MTSTRPYLIRAFYDWICDNQFTPYLVINAEFSGVVVPKEYVQGGQIVLNIAPMVVTALDLGNEWILFDARFSGKLCHIAVPVRAIMAIYAKENGQGIVFSEEEEEGDDTSQSEPTPTDKSAPKDKSKSRAKLRIIK